MYSLCRKISITCRARPRACWLVGDSPRQTGNFSPEEENIRNWLFYREHSGDIIVEQNVHSLDVVNWYLGAHPPRAVGWGGRLVRTDIGNIQDQFSVIYEYPGGIILAQAANQFSKGLFGRVIEEFICTNGAIETSRRKVTIYDATAVSWTIESKVEISVNMLDQFIACILKWQGGERRNLRGGEYANGNSRPHRHL